MNKILLTTLLMTVSLRLYANNSPTTAYNLGTYGGVPLTVMGAIDTGGDVDWYRVRITQPSVLLTRIPANLTTLWLWIEVFSSNATTLLNDSYSAPGGEVNIETVLDSGTYYIRVRSWLSSGSNPNPYTLMVNADLTDTGEFNPTKGLAHAVQCNASIVAKLRGVNYLYPNSNGYAPDRDWYKVTIPRAGILITSIPTNNTLLPFWIKIYDGAGLVNDRGATLTSGGSVYSETLVDTGVYWIEIDRYVANATDTNAYNLLIRLDTSDKYEWNSSFDKAYDISQVDTVQAAIRGYSKRVMSGSNYDLDWYKRQVTKNAWVVAYMPPNNAYIGYELSFFDPAVSLAAPKGYVYSNTPGTMLKTQSLVTLGNYYLRVDGYNSNRVDSGFYRLVVNIDSNNSASDAVGLRACDTIIAQTRITDDTDYYHVPVGSEWTFTAFDINPAIALTITAFDNSGNMLGNATAVTTVSLNLSSSIAYVRVRETNGSGLISRYKISITNLQCGALPVKPTLSKIHAINISPNPSSGIFSIETGADNHEPRTIIITDAYGKKVCEQTTTLGKLEIRLNQPAGVYFVTVGAPNGNAIQKLLLR